MASSPLFIAVSTIVLSSSLVYASPKSDAGKHFAEGLRLYAEKDFSAAATALKISYELHADQRTLFAWAQSERRLGNCQASRKLLSDYISNGATGKQSQAAYRLMSDCEPAVSDGKEPIEKFDQPDEPEPIKDPVVADEAPEPNPVVSAPAASVSVDRPWYRDWIGVTLLGTGAVGLAFSAFEYSTALSEEDSATKAGVTYQQFLEHKDNAQSSRTLSLVSGLVGGALIGAGVVYIFVLDPDSSQEQSMVVGIFDGYPSVGISGDF